MAASLGLSQETQSYAYPAASSSLCFPSLTTDDVDSAAMSFPPAAVDGDFVQELRPCDYSPPTTVLAGGNGYGGSSRIGFRTRSEVEILDDGFRWRKYGKKAVKSSPNPRNYYRCSSEGCEVKKRVERDRDDPGYVVTTYDGVHNHATPAPGAHLLISPPHGDMHYPDAAAAWSVPGAPNAGLASTPAHAAAAAAHSSESSY